MNRIFICDISNPTRGLWLDIDAATGLDSWDECIETLLSHLRITEGGDACLPGEIGVADAEGLAGRFVNRYMQFDHEGFFDCRDVYGDDDAKVAFIDMHGSWSEESFQDAYQGQWDSEEDFAENFAADKGLLDSMPDDLLRYFDYEKFAHDLFITDYYYCVYGGFVFNRNY